MSNCNGPNVVEKVCVKVSREILNAGMEHSLLLRVVPPVLMLAPLLAGNAATIMAAKVGGVQSKIRRTH